MNDTHIEACNPIFQTVHEFYDREQYTRYLEWYLSENNHTKSVYMKHKLTNDTHDQGSGTSNGARK
jgi:hypothetical protein